MHQFAANFDCAHVDVEAIQSSESELNCGVACSDLAQTQCIEPHPEDAAIDPDKLRFRPNVLPKQLVEVFDSQCFVDVLRAGLVGRLLLLVQVLVDLTVNFVLILD